MNQNEPSSSISELITSGVSEFYHERLRPKVGTFYLHTVRPRIKEVKNTYEYSVNGSGRIDQSVSTNKRDVLIVTVDCLRADHLSVLGYDRETTPFLDDFGTSFANAISAAPWTFPSVSSILTGYYPYQHGARYEEDFRNPETNFPPNGLTEDVPSLFNIFDAAGYNTRFSTAVYTAGIPFQGRVPSLKFRNNATAEEILDKFADWWRGANDYPRFGYLHLTDLHIPLLDPGIRPFGPIDLELDDLTDWAFRSTVKPSEEFEHYREHRIKLYDTLLRYVDQELERFFESIGDDLDDTLVFVLGDHGEEFWEHHEIERELFEHPYGDYGIDHGHSMFQELINVPLIVKNAQIDPSTREEYVSTVDIVPTVLDELDISWEPSDPYPGKSLSGDSDRSHPVFSEETAYGHQQRAVVADGYKYIHSTSAGVSLLYDLESDPDERDDLSDQKRLQQTLDELRGGIPSEAVSGERSEVDAEAREHLADLGYL